MKRAAILAVTGLLLTGNVAVGDMLDTWVMRNSGTNVSFTGLDFGNGTYVVVSSAGTILTSPDALTWTPRNSGTNVSPGDVAYGNSLFVIVGQSGTILTSPDGVSWAPHASGTTNSYFNRVRFLNGQFIAVGDGDAIVTSLDGINWTPQNSGLPVPPSPHDPNNYLSHLYNVTYANGTYVIVGKSSTILTSPDSVHWTSHVINVGCCLGDVAFGDGTFVISGYGGVIQTSPTGLAWTSQTSLPLPSTGLAGLVFAQGSFVGAGGYGAIFTSPNGTNWTQRVSGTAVNLWNVKYVNGTFMAVGDNGTILQTVTFPQIVQQPSGQFAQVGSNVVFSVLASGAPPLGYQWQFNGQNLAGRTAASLSLSNVQLANAGSYSVIVSNTYGSVSSAIASLAVLTDGVDGNTPVQTTASPVPAKTSGVKNLVFVTHGWQSVELNLTGPPPQPWMVQMTNDIQEQVTSDWQVEAYYWLSDAWTLLPGTALNNAQNLGAQLGKQFAAQGWQHVHLIAHSAGSGMIQAIADQLESSPKPPTIHMTFLDPYLGAFLEEQNVYGQNADWSDCYFVEDGTGGFTSGNLNYAFNVDVSWVDPAHTAAPYLSLSGGEVALSSHGYPTDFYSQSITDTDPNWCAAGYGFALSKEREGAFWLNNQANDPVGSGPFLPCSPADAVKNPNPGVAGTEAGAVGAWVFISGLPHAVSGAAATLIGNAGFELQSLWSASSLGTSGGVHPMGGTPSTNTPAWLAVGVTVTNAVNFVQFDAAFTDTNAAQGLLTVYWNTNQIGMVDERVASPGLQMYRFVLPGTVMSGIYTLSFRLDSFTNSSSIAVTNVATGFVGVTQPITLGISLTNRAPRLQLTGPPGYNYLLQASTNLVDWTPIALLANTNGTVLFVDSAVTNYSRRFYQAVILSSIAARPSLQAQVSGNNFILSWPASATGYALETSTNLAATGSWTAVTNVPVVLNQQNVVTNAMSGRRRFYRLQMQ